MLRRVLLLLFISSYSPLWLMLMIRWYDNDALRIVLGLLAVVGLAVTLWLLNRDRKEPPEDEEYLIVGDAGAEVGGYLAAYLLPFLTVNEPDGQDVAAYAIFIAVVAVVWMRSGMVHINPTLYILGRKVYIAERELAHGPPERIFVISAVGDLRPRAPVKVRQLAGQARIHQRGPTKKNTNPRANDEDTEQ